MSTIVQKDKPLTFHFRGSKLASREQSDFVSQGGATAVFDPASNKLAISLCCNRDNFCRKTGRVICLTRLNSSKVEKKQRQRRFRYVYEYNGSNDIKDIHIFAANVVVEAAKAVGNSTITKSYIG